MTDTVYDVVIVGGGVAGATVAKTLAETRGKRILVLEAGRATGMSAEKYGSHVEFLQSQLIKYPNTPYPSTPNAPQADGSDVRQILGQPTPGQAPGTVADSIGYLVQTGPLPFLSDYTRALGGTTLHWLGTSLRMLPNDFQLQTLYGQGVDWPIGYDDLRPYYERAETDVLGVAGSVTEQHYPGIDPATYFGDYDYPMQQLPYSYSDQVIAGRLNGKSIQVDDVAYEVQMSSTPAARNSTPNGSYQPIGMPGNPQTGTRCEGNTNCIPICPVQAKYSALKTWYELLRLYPGDPGPTSTRSSVTVLTQAVATKVNLDESGRVSGITYQTYEDEDVVPTNPPEVARGTIYVLAGNAVHNATLMLASGVGNSSGQVGRNLMDHPLILTWGLMPKPVWGFRGPLSTAGLEMFRDGPFRDRSCAFRIEVGNEGWNFATGAPNSTVAALVSKGVFGTRLREAIGQTMPRQMRLGLEMEQTPEASNFVTIDNAYRDQLGNFRPVIRYDLPDYVRAGFAMAKQASDRMFALLGMPPLVAGADDGPDPFPFPADYTKYNPTDAGFVTYGEEGFTFQGAGHVAGTHRMGKSPLTSVVNPRQRSWDHDNLFLVGCGNMPTVGTSNPTLTMTALAIWAADNIAEDLAVRS